LRLYDRWPLVSEGIALGILWGSIGYVLLSLRGTVAEQPSRPKLNL
jgi:hypothetical protein